MPNCRGHLWGGIGAFIIMALLAQTSWQNQWFATASAANLMACLLGALLPDVDVGSVGRKLAYLLLALGFCLSLHFKTYAMLMVLGSVFVFIQMVSHRGLTHHPLFACFVPPMLAVVSCRYAQWLPVIDQGFIAYLMAGIWSHLVLDAFTPQGVVRKTVNNVVLPKLRHFIRLGKKKRGRSNFK